MVVLGFTFETLGTNCLPSRRVFEDTRLKVHIIVTASLATECGPDAHPELDKCNMVIFRDMVGHVALDI